MSHWDKRSPLRYRQEIDAMKGLFPGFTLYRTRDGRLFWEGSIGPILGGRSYRIHLEYPDDFPFKEITIRVISPSLEPSPHRHDTDIICAVHWCGSFPFEPAISAAEYVAYASTWFLAYEHHRSTCRRNGGRPCTLNGCPDWISPGESP